MEFFKIKIIPVLTIVLLTMVSERVFGQMIHSHNDYLRENPFWEAYQASANSIEADVFLVDGKLFVAHEKKEIKQEATLEKLYLEPLNQIVKSKKRQNLQILIDLKTSAEPTLASLIEAIQKYPNLSKSHTQKKYVKFVISGNRPASGNYSDYPDFIYFDHQSIEDLTNLPKQKIALISFPFYRYSLWNGKNNISENDSLKLAETIKTVHQNGYKIRFWASPDTAEAWKLLRELEADFINTDRPAACRKFLDSK